MNFAVDPIVIGCFVLFVVLMLLRMPIPFAMFTCSIIYGIFYGESFAMFAQKISKSFSDWSMLAVPAFLFVGSVMNEVGLSTRIFAMFDRWIGHWPGGLAHANVMASMVFAGMSGSALADAGGLGTIEVRAMQDAGYEDGFCVAVTAASSTIGPIIPPSINLIMWGYLSSVSTTALFMGGLIPGILMGISMMILIVIMVKTEKISAPRSKKGTWKERFISVCKAIPALMGPAILMGGIMGGVFTPTECGVVAAAYCVFLGIAYRKVNFATIRSVLRNTVSSCAVVMGLTATGLVFNWMIVTSGLIDALTNMLLALNSEILVLLVLNIAMLVLGCFIGSMQIMLMMSPLLLTISSALGFDLVHIGVVVVFNLVIGLITPPFAPALFMTCKATNVDFKKALPLTVQFLIPLILVLILITYFPTLVLWLPKTMGIW